MWNSHCSANSACRQRLFLATGNTCCAVSLVYIIHNENARKPTELLAPPLLTDAACAVFNRAALTFQQIASFFFLFFFLPTAVQIFQESPQLWEEVKLHQEEPECSGDEERLAAQAGTRVGVLAPVSHMTRQQNHSRLSIIIRELVELG